MADCGKMKKQKKRRKNLLDSTLYSIFFYKNQKLLKALKNLVHGEKESLIFNKKCKEFYLPQRKLKLQF